MSALLEAEAITPEQIRNHRITYRLVSDLLTMRDPPPAELRELTDQIRV